jgi:hypothetical protein
MTWLSSDGIRFGRGPRESRVICALPPGQLADPGMAQVSEEPGRLAATAVFAASCLPRSWPVSAGFQGRFSGAGYSGAHQRQDGKGQIVAKGYLWRWPRAR